MKKILISFLFVFTTLQQISANEVCDKKLFTFSVNGDENEVSILDVLENIASICKISIIFKDKESKRKAEKNISYINVHDFTLTELLDMLLKDNNLFYTLEKNGKILKISYKITKSFPIDYVSFSQRKSSSNKTIKTGSSGEDGDDSTTVNFTSEFKFWDKIEKEIKNILSSDPKAEAKVMINQEAGILTVTGTYNQIKEVEKYVKTILKRLHKQVLIDTKIIEITFDKEHNEGIDWSKFQISMQGNSDATKSRVDKVVQGSFSYPNYLIGYNFTIEALMQFLKTQGEVNIVSNPKILTLNNQPAIINVGKEVNYQYSTGVTTTSTNSGTTTTPEYQVDSTFVGITLDITPEITQNDDIILKINPVVSEIADEHKDEKGVPYLAPDVKLKQLSSIVKVKNGKKILLGGLIQKREETVNTKVPILGSIPIIKHAFSGTRKKSVKSELIMIITPYIINGDEKFKSFPTLEDFEHRITE